MAFGHSFESDFIHKRMFARGLWRSAPLPRQYTSIYIENDPRRRAKLSRTVVQKQLRLILLRLTPLRCYQPELSQVAAKRVDELGPLADEEIPRLGLAPATGAKLTD
jgi:hypothetical protein